MRADMRRQRPTSILVIAILHLVGGGLGLLFALCGLGGIVLSSAVSSAVPTAAARPGQPAPPPSYNDIMKFYDDNVPGYRAYTYGVLALDTVLDFMLLAAGVGLLTMKPWARWLSLIYAALSILYHLGTLTYSLALVIPATQKLYAQNPALSGMSGFLNFTSGMGVVMNLVLIIYPITVIIVMLLPATSAAFRGQLRPVVDELDQYDDRWQEPPASDKFHR
jgi:hypothetical protein